MNYTIAKEFPLSTEQNEIVNFMINKPQAICAAQTGLGKTLTLLTSALWLMSKYNNLALVVICPPKALKAFRKELKRLNILWNTLESDTRDFDMNKRVTLVTNTSIDKYVQEIVDYRTRYNLIALIDEAHCMQDPDGELYKIMMRLRTLFTVVWGATATPLKNDITGLYNLVSIIKPGHLGTWEDFKYKYLVIEVSKIRRNVSKGDKPVWIESRQEDIVGLKNVEHLSKLLDEIVILRQLEYNLEFHYCKTKLTEEEEHFYMLAGKGEFMEKKAKSNWAARLHQLQRIVDNVHQDHVTNSNKMSSKEKMLMQVIIERMKSGTPCIVYFDYKEALNRIKSILEQTKSITGVEHIFEVSSEISLKKREKVEESICNNSVVLVTQAGTESINLQRANAVIFYDIPFAIQSFIQMVGRVTRMDTEFNKQDIYFIEAEGTSDTYRRIMIQINGDFIRKLFGKMNTLPLDINFVDRRMLKKLKSALLWSFKTGKIASEADIRRIIDIDENPM